jgi:excisionase family DNA binding protein
VTILLTAEESATELRIGRTKMFDLIKRGKVTSVMVDGSRRVPYDELTAYVQRLVAEQSDGIRAAGDAI